MKNKLVRIFAQILLLTFFISESRAQFPSGIYHFPSIKKSGETVIFDHPSLDFKTMKMLGLQLVSGKSRIYKNLSEENLIIVKSGNVMVNDSLMSPGSVAIVPMGSQLKIKAQSSNCQLYIMRYLHNDNTWQNTSAFKPMLWEIAAYISHNKGGRRNFYDGPTGQCKRLEIHVTTLNKGLNSHPPHTHRAAEIILLKEGKGDMIIGDKTIAGQTGDLWLVESMVPHNITNTDLQPITYFAYQFE